MATNEQMKIEFSYFGEVWSFFKRFYEVQEDDSYWDAVVIEGERIVDKYNCPLCKSLVLAVLNELERKSRAELEAKYEQ